MVTVEGNYPLIIKWSIRDFFNIPAKFVESDEFHVFENDETRMRVEMDWDFDKPDLSKDIWSSKITIKTIPEYLDYEDAMLYRAPDRSESRDDGELTKYAYPRGKFEVLVNLNGLPLSQQSSRMFYKRDDDHIDDDFVDEEHKFDVRDLDVTKARENKSDLQVVFKFWIDEFQNRKQNTETKTFNTIDEDIRDYFTKCDKIPTDVVLTGSNGSVSSNRLLLSARSAVFKAMFEANMTESKTGEVDMTDVTVEVIKAFLKFLQFDKVDDSATFASDLFILGDKYQVLGLKDICEKFLVSKVTMDTSAKLLALTQKVPSKAIERKLMELYNGSA